MDRVAVSSIARWGDGNCGLDNVSMIDARSVRIAETVIAPVSGTLDRIPFSLTVTEPVSKSASYTLSAEIRRSRPGALSRGDFLTTAQPSHGPKANLREMQ